jgi:hypothetical protein
MMPIWASRLARIGLWLGSRAIPSTMHAASLAPFGAQCILMISVNF